MRFPSILYETSCHLLSISNTDIRLCYQRFRPHLYRIFSVTRSRFHVSKKKKNHEETMGAMETTTVYPAQSDFRYTVFRVSSESKSPLTKLHCVGHIYYSSSLLSSNRIPARQRQSDSILIGCDGGGGGDRRESQFPERSRCNLRLKQRGGTTITDCIRSTERVIPGTGDAGIHRHVAVYTTVHTRVSEVRVYRCKARACLRVNQLSWQPQILVPRSDA